MFVLLFILCILLQLTNAISPKSVPKEVKNKETRRKTVIVDASSRTGERKPDYKAQTDFQNILNQHLLASIPSSTAVSSKEDKPKGKLQTIGSVLGDIIGVLISEVSRFFGSVISDVAREVTAHGFVNVLRQFAELTGFGSHSSRTSNNQPVRAQFG